MGWMRTAVLVTLTLVAATLPLSGESAPAADTGSAAHKAGICGESPSGKSPAKPTERSSGLIVHAAANTDVWAGSTMRPQPGDGSPPHAAVLLPAALLHTQPWSTPGRFIRQANEPPPAQTRAWLACRYPNAPPESL